jgi:hypothetical protein
MLELEEALSAGRNNDTFDSDDISIEVRSI